MPSPKGKAKPKSKPVPKKAAVFKAQGQGGATAVAKKKPKGKKPKKPPPLTVKQYLLDSLTSISNFFSFVFASDFTPRTKELVDASITFMHYN